MSISYNKSLSLTGQDIYKQTYENQYINIMANATSYLIGTLIGAVLLFALGDGIFINKNKTPYFYIFFVILIVLFIIIPLAINLLTYQKSHQRFL